MKKKIEQKWIRSKKANKLSEEEAELRKMKRSSEKQDLPSPLFESFYAVIIAK